MNLFVDALMITGGALGAFFLFNLTRNFLVVVQNKFKRVLEAKNWQDRQEYLAHKQQLQFEKAKDLLRADSNVAEIVEGLRQNPYKDSGSNKERARFQKQLREKVESQSLRDALYALANNRG